ncbi:hypothetical protein NUU61_008727 [Penicillium alfredii]|uniref:Uncharacterized protein n=1 Tax=Penicillium alfredii TaxID=1506179 RepID=A0A9W9JWI2_9EURO|nr:uncharacterized protein NUU61_008727 [Penicillium alfredii]KAJ5084148.1 hypothetical protein NUU61_008727 [Penicillium alfredii]
MCFGMFASVKPQPPRREAYKNENKYQRDYERYQKQYAEYMDKDNRRRRMQNSNTGALAGTTAAIGG